MDIYKHTILVILLLVTILSIIGIIIIAFVRGHHEGCMMRYPCSTKNARYLEDEECINKLRGNEIEEIIQETVTVHANGMSGLLKEGTKNQFWDQLDLVDDKEIKNVYTNEYGRWVRLNHKISASDEFWFYISGSVSLCRAYLPEDNPNGETNLNTNGEKIPIPRHSEYGNGLPLILNAKKNEWSNITEIFENDIVTVTLDETSDSPALAKEDVLTSQIITADCKIGECPHAANNKSWLPQFKDQDETPCVGNKTKFNPICGKYSIYSGDYYTKCYIKDLFLEEKKSHKKCGIEYAINELFGGATEVTQGLLENKINNNKNIIPGSCSCENKIDEDTGSSWSCWYSGSAQITITLTTKCTCKEAVFSNLSSLPTPYSPDNAILDNSKMGKLPQGIASCPFNISAPKSWYAATNGNGIRYQIGKKDIEYSKLDPLDRILIQLEKVNYEDLGESTGVLTPESEALVELNSKTNFFDEATLSRSLSYGMKGYLKMSLFTSSDPDINTGGYVIRVKHDKCFRQRGESYTDTFQDRGRIKYLILPSGVNPNIEDKESEAQYMDFDADGNTGHFKNKSGYFWFKINNHPDDYKESAGEYKITLTNQKTLDGFIGTVIKQILGALYDFRDISREVFQNITCYKINDKSKCYDIFNYIRAMLTLYVMIYGMMFIVGLTELNAYDLTIRVIKIIIVGGLLNEKTFIFFDQHVFDLVTNFARYIMLSASGYTPSFDLNENPSLALEDQNILDVGWGALRMPVELIKDMLGGDTYFPSSIDGAMLFLPFDKIWTRVFLEELFKYQVLALLSINGVGILYFLLILISILVFLFASFQFLISYIISFVGISILLGLAPIFLTFMLFNQTRYLFDNFVQFIIRYMVEPVLLYLGLVVLTDLFVIYLDYCLNFSVCFKCVFPFALPLPANIIGFNASSIPLFCFYWYAMWGFNPKQAFGMSLTHIAGLSIIAFTSYKYVVLIKQMCDRLFGGIGTLSSSLAPVSKITQDISKGISKKIFGIDSNVNVVKSEKRATYERQMYNRNR